MGGALPREIELLIFGNMEFGALNGVGRSCARYAELLEINWKYIRTKFVDIDCYDNVTVWSLPNGVRHGDSSVTVGGISFRAKYKRGTPIYWREYRDDGTTTCGRVGSNITVYFSGATHASRIHYGATASYSEFYLLIGNITRTDSEIGVWLYGGGGPLGNHKITRPCKGFCIDGKLDFEHVECWLLDQIKALGIQNTHTPMCEPVRFSYDIELYDAIGRHLPGVILPA